MGISRARQRRLFQPFQQSDSSVTREFGGTGLGLAICHRLVTCMGGEIGVDSEPDKGARFHFAVRLECGDAAGIDRPVSLGTEQRRRLRGLRVLVAEDNALNRELAVQVLSKHGIQVVTAEHGRAALELLSAERLDLVLMDLRMPVMDGFETARAIRGREGLKDLPIIALTADVTTSDRDRVLASGMNALIGKPFETEELLARIAACVSAAGRPRASDLGDPECVPVPNERAIGVGALDSSPDADPLDALDAVDRSGLPDYLHDAQTYRGVLDVFRREQRDFAQRFAQARDGRDQDAMVRAAHTLKGTAACIGATGVQDAARDLESLCRESAPEDRIDSARERAVGQLDQLLTQVDALMPPESGSAREESRNQTAS
ncbi:MAG: response regulator [Gammaproteobacteria bacterium]